VTSGAADGVIELRRYALHPGQRETLIELFDRELVEPQEAAGIRVLGQFRDLDDPNSFVWLRGFEDMTVRQATLAAFYGGPVWREFRDAANATMIDSDNVLLLRPAKPAAGLGLDPRDRPPPGTESAPPGMIGATICSLRPSKAAAFPKLFERELEPTLREAGADVVAAFSTEHSPNSFPTLPVREGEEVFVWLSRFPDPSAHADHHTRLDLTETLADHVVEAPETLRLTPTSRSLLR
jgi:quinol monooxygenase YgiN